MAIQSGTYDVNEEMRKAEENIKLVLSRLIERIRCDDVVVEVEFERQTEKDLWGNKVTTDLIPKVSISVLFGEYIP